MCGAPYILYRAAHTCMRAVLYCTVLREFIHFHAIYSCFPYSCTLCKPDNQLKIDPYPHREPYPQRVCSETEICYPMLPVHFRRAETFNNVSDVFRADVIIHTSTYSCTYIQGLADARKRAHRSGLVQFFAVYQFDRGGILQMCHTVGELCNHAVRGSGLGEF